MYLWKNVTNVKIKEKQAVSIIGKKLLKNYLIILNLTIWLQKSAYHREFLRRLIDQNRFTLLVFMQEHSRLLAQLD